MSEPFRYGLRVRYHECDPQGVVFNSHYLAYFDIGITELWREAGGYEEMMADGTDIVVAEAGIRYLSPLRFDDQFVVAITVARLGNTSMTTRFRLEREGEPVAEGELRHVFVATARGETIAIPERIRSGLARYAAEEGSEERPRP